MSYHFKDSKGNTKGPLPRFAIVRLLLKGSAFISKDTQISNKSNEWSQLSSFDTFSPVLNQLDKSWYYLDLQNNPKGPCSTGGLISFIDDGDVDGMTLVWSKDMTTWQKVQDIDDLKGIMHMLQDKDEPVNLAPVPLNSNPNSTIASSNSTTAQSNSTTVQSTDAQPTPPAKRKREEDEGFYWIKITNLPLNVTISEICDHFKPVGIIQLNPINLSEAMIIIDATDAYLAFHYSESRNFAIMYLNESQIRVNNPIQITLPNQAELDLLSRYSSNSNNSRLIMKSLTSWKDDDDDDDVGLKIVETHLSYSSQEELLNELAEFGDVVKLVELNDSKYRIHFKSITSATACVYSDRNKYYYYDDEEVNADV